MNSGCLLRTGSARSRLRLCRRCFRFFSTRFSLLRLCRHGFRFFSTRFSFRLNLCVFVSRSCGSSFRCLRQVLRYFLLNSRIGLTNHSKRVYAEQLRLTLILLRKPSVCWRQGYPLAATTRLTNHKLSSLRIAYYLHNMVDTHSTASIMLTRPCIHADHHTFFKTSLSQLLFIQDLSSLFPYVSNNAFRGIIDRCHIFFRENFSTRSSIDLLHHSAVCCS